MIKNKIRKKRGGKRQCLGLSDHHSGSDEENSDDCDHNSDADWVPELPMSKQKAAVSDESGKKRKKQSYKGVRGDASSHHSGAGKRDVDDQNHGNDGDSEFAESVEATVVVRAVRPLMLDEKVLLPAIVVIVMI